MPKCNKRHEEFFKKQFKLASEEEANKLERQYVDEAICNFYLILAVFSKQVGIVDSKIKRS